MIRNGRNGTIDGKYGIINKDGKEVIPCKYDIVSDFKNGLSFVELNGKAGIINIHGDELWF